MGLLLQTLKSKGNIVTQYKDNTNFFGQAYSQNSADGVKTVSKGKMQIGRFYFLHYADDSNWMQFSPIMAVGLKRLNNMFIIQAINLNFIPLQIRSLFFDKFLKDFEKEDQFNWVTYKNVYAELLKIGYEYALVEYNFAMIHLVHKIDLHVIDRFLYSS